MPCVASGSVTIVTDFRVCPSGSPKAPVKSVAAKARVVSSATLLAIAPAVGGSSTAVTVTVTVAAATDSWSLESVTW